MFTEIIKDKWENKNKNDKAAIELWNSKAVTLEAMIGKCTK